MKPNPGLSRRVPLKRVSPLGRGESGLSRRVPLKAVPRTPRAPRDTGPPRKVRALVLKRDSYACAGCGKGIKDRPYSLQHRQARGMGGTSREDVNSPVNLVVLCGSATSPGGCHLACEQRDPVMHERGLWLHSWEDPALVPVAVASSAGVALRWPLANGKYSAAAPKAAAA